MNDQDVKRCKICGKVEGFCDCKPSPEPLCRDCRHKNDGVCSESVADDAVTQCTRYRPSPEPIELSGESGELGTPAPVQSAPYSGEPATCECDYHKACRGEKPAQIQSAEELLCLIRGREKCGEDAGDLIEADRARQREKGRQDAFEELERNDTAYQKWLEGKIAKRHADLVKAARHARSLLLKYLMHLRSRNDPKALRLTNELAALNKELRELNKELRELNYVPPKPQSKEVQAANWRRLHAEGQITDARLAAELERLE